jgi:hypothetical protein
VFWARPQVICGGTQGCNSGGHNPARHGSDIRDSNGVNVVMPCLDDIASQFVAVSAGRHAPDSISWAKKSHSRLWPLNAAKI